MSIQYEYEESPFINTKHETERQTRLILIALGHALFVFEFPSEEKLVKFPDDEKCGLKVTTNWPCFVIVENYEFSSNILGIVGAISQRKRP